MPRMLTILFSLLGATSLFFGGMVLLQPGWLFARLRHRSPAVLYQVDTTRPLVALTIDDGPDAQTTPLILDVLQEYNARATFFLISGRVTGNEALVRRMVAAGHELGNHLTADEPSIQLPLAEFERKLLKADAVLKQFGGARWARPGSGWYNQEMLDIMAAQDYRCALGSVYPYDPQIGSAWFSTRYILWKVKPGDIIVLHDYGSRGRRTARTLAAILPELQRRGYKVVTLSELVALGDKTGNPR